MGAYTTERINREDAIKQIISALYEVDNDTLADLLHRLGIGVLIDWDVE